jgi:flagellar FliL protein
MEFKMNKTIGMIIITLLFIIASLLGAYIYFTLDDIKETTPVEMTNIHTSTIQTLEMGKNEEKISKVGALYALDPFTLNLRSEKGNVYLKIKIVLELSIPELKNELDAKQAVVRDAIIRILTSKTVEDLSDDEGKEDAMDEIINDLNSMLHDGYIKNAYITEFVTA